MRYTTVWYRYQPSKYGIYWATIQVGSYIPLYLQTVDETFYRSSIKFPLYSFSYARDVSQLLLITIPSLQQSSFLDVGIVASQFHKVTLLHLMNRYPQSHLIRASYTEVSRSQVTDRGIDCHSSNHVLRTVPFNFDCTAMEAASSGQEILFGAV